VNALRDEFLSEEDLDLRNLSDKELVAWWNEWLRLAQATNDRDAATYSHGVFEVDPYASRCAVAADRMRESEALDRAEPTSGGAGDEAGRGPAGRC
jgi:hypothetical protein